MTAEELETNDRFLVLATSGGKIKRMALSSVSNIRNAGLMIMNLNPNDELVSVRPSDPVEDVIMVTKQGMSIRFPSSEVRPQQRAAGGVRGMKLESKDRVISMDVGTDDTRLLVISKLGYGKITPLSSYRVTGRGGKGIKTFNIRSKTGVVADAQVIDDSKEVYVVSEQAQVLRTSLSEIRSMGRATQGVTIFKPAEGDSVASISCVSDLNLRVDDDPKPANAGKKLKVKKPANNGARNGRANGSQPTLDGLE
jgi:DNA gyrase subunit A